MKIARFRFRVRILGFRGGSMLSQDLSTVVIDISWSVPGQTIDSAVAKLRQGMDALNRRILLLMLAWST